MNRDAFDEQTWVMAAGSVWKGHPLMFTRFREVIWEKHPKTVAEMPLFEPVMGASSMKRWVRERATLWMVRCCSG